MPKKFIARIFSISILLGSLLAALPTYAHEVYVLDKQEIALAMAEPHLPVADIIATHLGQLALWGIGGVILIVLIYLFSVARPLEKILGSALSKIKHFAPALTQATIGLALIASAYYGAAFGVELPFSLDFPGLLLWARILFFLSGTLILFGILPRVGGLIITLVFGVLWYKFGVYMLNYATYFGEAFALLVWGGGYSLHKNESLGLHFRKSILIHLHKYKFLWLRICFGTSLIYASLYAKYLHAGLALETVAKYHLTNYFPFDPQFLVLGAFLIEIMIGLFFILGFEIRFTSLFFLTFLILSVSFFGEAVWPHIILVGTAVSIFVHGYDEYSLSVKLSGRKDLEPVL